MSKARRQRDADACGGLSANWRRTEPFQSIGNEPLGAFLLMALEPSLHPAPEPTIDAEDSDLQYCFLMQPTASPAMPVETPATDTKRQGIRERQGRHPLRNHAVE